MSGPLAGIVIYMPHLPVGGAERMLLRLSDGLARRGHRVSFLLDRMEGDLLGAVPGCVAVEALDAPRSLAAIPRLAGWLRRKQPAILLSALSHQNIVAIMACWLAQAPTRVVVSEHTVLSRQTAETGTWQHKMMPLMARRLYPLAAARVAVSRATLEDLAEITGLPADRFDLIHNPVIPDEIIASGTEPAAGEPWFHDGGPPVIVAAGRLVPLKDFGVLLHAVAALRRERPVRLLILGDGPERAELEGLRDRLDLSEVVRMPGAVADTLSYFAGAAAVAVTSHYEGFGVVLVEAMACGTPVVSTACPGGPAEILEAGRLGPLVPIGDAGALARALDKVMDEPPPADMLRARAANFTVSRSVEAYESLFNRLMGFG